MEIKILIGESIIAGELTIYPIARLSILRTADMSVQNFWLSPLALVVTVPELKAPFIVSLTSEKIDHAKLIDMTNALQK
ncbi:MAG: hypothetical protein LUQ38_11865 [Methanotrichaceae archaeon]|nr:hypothetical protein [Methanotrichaceae archaeon]